MQIITIAVNKGGTGKTTTAAALAQAAALRKRKVLAIDLDPQANLTYTLGASSKVPGSYELLTGQETALQHIAPRLDAIAASLNLADLTTAPGSAKRLEQALKPLTGKYDLIIIDTPPTIGEMQYNALQASTGLIIPLQASIYSLQSLYQMADLAAVIRKSNPQLQVLGFILTQHAPRSVIARQMEQTITDKAAAVNIPYIGAIRKAVAVDEAAALQKSIFDYAPKSNPAQDYLTLAKKLHL